MNKRTYIPELVLLIATVFLICFCTKTHSAETGIKNLKVSGTFDATGVTSSTGVSALGAQPLDADLTAIAALTTTSYGRSVLAVADAAALRTYAGLVIGTNVLAPNGNGSALTSLTAANITAAGTLPALNGAALTSLTAANITAAGTLPALNGAALTSLTAANITAGGTLPALNGSALTALNATNLASGTVASARLGTNLAAMDANTSTSLIMSNVTPTFAAVVSATATHSGAVTAGTLAVGGGIVVTKVLANVATLDFPITLTLTSSDLAITVTGAAVQDPVILGVPNGSVLSNSCFTAWVSATNTVTVRFSNFSVGSLDPASGNFDVIVFHF